MIKGEMMLTMILLLIILILFLWILKSKNEIERRKSLEKDFKYREEHFKIAPIFIDFFDIKGH
jgi:hypothetical protein